MAERCISVRVRGALYGLAMSDVREVVSVRPLASVFHAVRAMAGVMSLRGEILPVVDLGVLLGDSRATDRKDERVRVVVVAVRTDPGRRAGLLVDELAKIRDVPESGLAKAPETLRGTIAELVRGVISDAPPCVVLDVGAILSSPSLANPIA